MSGEILLVLGAYIGGIICLTFYLTRLREQRTRAALIFGAAALAGATFTAYEALYSFGGGFGYGTLLCFASGFLGLVVALWLLVSTFRILRSRPWQGIRRQQALVLAGIPLIVLTVYAPVVGPFGLGGVCDWLNRERAQPLIAGVEAYHSDNGGSYPPDLAALLPRYIADLPQPACFPTDSSWDYKDYNLTGCSTGETLLTVYTIRGVAIQRYNFSTGRWSSISFLDGECNFL